MTIRLIWESVLIERSKVNAPSLLLHEFNYFVNKAINQYVNKRYNVYDINLLTSDDLRVLKATAILEPFDRNNSNIELTSNLNGEVYLGISLYDNIYEVIFPDDYVHLLNCMCIYQLQKDYKCYKKDEFVLFAAKRLTADSWSIISNDYYNRPLPERPYYYLHNVNLSTQLPTNLFNTELPGTTDSGLINDSNSEFPRTFKIGDSEISTTELVQGLRHANASKVRCEIRCGKSNTYILNKVLIDYIKAPLTVELTKSQLDLVEDTSLIMEFPDYVCQEIINELVLLVMTRDMDPRIQLQALVTLSITNPIQQLTTRPQ